MATQPPTKEQRDANLDILRTAVDEWADSETTRLNNETLFMRSVLQGRGASDVGTKNLASASTVLQAEINEYLIGT